MSSAREWLTRLEEIELPPPPPESSPLWWLPPAVLVLWLCVTLLRRHGSATRPSIRRRLRRAERLAPRAALDEFAAVLRLIDRSDGIGRGDTLSGEAWLAHLDHRFHTRWFTTGHGRIFGDALYRPGVPAGFDPEREGRALRRLWAGRPA